ncbi:hypothetical protein HY837_02845 [archaeon]|nr:hypothetical protein [archaeon]
MELCKLIKKANLVFWKHSLLYLVDGIKWAVIISFSYVFIQGYVAKGVIEGLWRGAGLGIGFFILVLVQGWLEEFTIPKLDKKLAQLK